MSWAAIEVRENNVGWWKNVRGVWVRENFAQPGKHYTIIILQSKAGGGDQRQITQENEDHAGICVFCNVLLKILNNLRFSFVFCTQIAKHYTKPVFFAMFC